MAETKSTNTRRKNTEKSVDNINNVTIDNEDALTIERQKNEQLSEMLKQLQEQMLAMQQQINNTAPQNVVIKQNDAFTKSFKVISLLPNEYNLSTQPLGKGKVYTFVKFGDAHTIKYADMQDILSLFMHQFEKGWAILTSKEDYIELGIEYIYDEVMNKEKLERLVSLKDKDSVDTICAMDDESREIICNIIAQKIAEGASYDYNKIKELEEEGMQISEIADLLKASNE